MVETAKIVWADGPSTAPNQPQKSQIRTWGTWLENMTTALGIMVKSAFIRGTKAQLDATSSSAFAGYVGIVVADDDEDLRGIYVYTGSSWQKKLDLPADAAELSAERAEAARDIALNYRNGAIDAREGAEAARDIAAGYASDAVSQGNVPIYATVAGMAALSVPQGINAIRVNGLTAAGDNGGGLYVRVASQPTDEFASLAFRSADRFLPTGATSSANGGWWAWKEKFSATEICKRIAADLQLGFSRIIACYGDSTTDGNNTSNWTMNPRNSDSSAIGVVDHMQDAPNAWPARLAWTLSSHFRAENLRVLNNGYSGRRIDDGWAYANFMAAVVNNSIGLTGRVPDCVIIDFGLNDMTATDQSTFCRTYISQTLKLCRLSMSLGIVPILKTCDPIQLNDPAVRAGSKLQIVNGCKSAVAAQLGILLLDIGADLDKWINRNADKQNYADKQDDGLHGGDVWSSFRGQAVARHFMQNYVSRTGPGDVQRVSPSDPAFQSPFPYDDNYTIRQSANGLVQTHTGAISTYGADLWIWNEDPEAELIYYGVANENYEAADLSAGITKPSHSIFDLTNIQNRGGRVPAGILFARSGHGLRADIPYRIGKLSYGFNRVRLDLGTATKMFVGHYQIATTPKWQTEARGANGTDNFAIPLNALKSNGHFLAAVRKDVVGQSVNFIPEALDKSNVVGCMGGDRADLYLRATIPNRSGVILGWTPSYIDRMGNRHDKSFLMLFKNSAGAIQFYLGTIQNGVVTTTALGAAVTYTAAPDAEGAEKFLIQLQFVGGSNQQSISLSQGWDYPLSTLQTLTLNAGELAAPAGFVMGGTYVNTASVASDYFNVRILDYFGKQVTLTPPVPEPTGNAP